MHPRRRKYRRPCELLVSTCGLCSMMYADVLDYGCKFTGRKINLDAKCELAERGYSSVLVTYRLITATEEEKDAYYQKLWDEGEKIDKPTSTQSEVMYCPRCDDGVEARLEEIERTIFVKDEAITVKACAAMCPACGDELWGEFRGGLYGDNHLDAAYDAYRKIHGQNSLDWED